MKAEIYWQNKDYSQATSNIKFALNIDPTNQTVLTIKHKIEQEQSKSTL